MAASTRSKERLAKNLLSKSPDLTGERGKARKPRPFRSRLRKKDEGKTLEERVLLWRARNHEEVDELKKRGWWRKRRAPTTLADGEIRGLKKGVQGNCVHLSCIAAGSFAKNSALRKIRKGKPKGNLLYIRGRRKERRKSVWH